MPKMLQVRVVVSYQAQYKICAAENGDSNSRDLQLAKKTDSTNTIPIRIDAVEEKRLCNDGCRKSLYGARLTGAIFTISHDRAKKRLFWGLRRKDDLDRMTAL